MPVATLNSFGGGLVTRPAPYLIGADEGVAVHNLDLRDGSLRSLKGLASDGSVTAGTVSMYRFKGEWFTHTAERWYTEWDNTLYWADGGIPQKWQEGHQARLGVKRPDAITATPKYASTWNYAVTRTSEPRSRFNEREIEYVMTFQSDPLLASGAKPEGWGGESAPTDAVSINQFIGELSNPLAVGDTSIIVLGTASYPAGGVDGYLHTTSNTEKTTLANAYDGATQNYIDVASASGFVVGQLVYVRNSTHTSSFSFILEEIVGNRLFFDTPKGVSFAVGIGVYVGGVIRVGEEILAYGVVKRGDPLEPGLYEWTLMGLMNEDGANTVKYAHERGSAVTCIIESVTLTLSTQDEDGLTDTQVNSRNLYRLSGGEYKLVMQIADNTTTSYTDSVNDEDLGAILESDLWDPPPNLTGIMGPYNGCLIGWSGYSVYVTEQANPDAWNPDYTVTLPYLVTACILYGSLVVVFTEGGIWTLSGGSPDSLTLHKAISEFGCDDPRTVVSTSKGCLFLAPEGICAFDGLNVSMLTETQIARATFDQMTSTRAAFFDGEYILFHGGGSFIMDLKGKRPVFRTSEVTADCAYVASEDPALYVVQGATRSLWAEGTPLEWTYTTGELKAGSLSEEKIVHTITLHYEGDVTVTMTMDGKLKHYKALSGDRRAHRMRVTGSSRGYRIQLSFAGTGILYGLEVEYSGPDRKR